MPRVCLTAATWHCRKSFGSLKLNLLWLPHFAVVIHALDWSFSLWKACWTIKDSYFIVAETERTSFPRNCIILVCVNICCGQHIEVETKWTSFRRRHFQAHFFNENIWIPIQISLKFVPKGSINKIPASNQIMAWRCPGDKPLSERMMVNLPTHICVTQPQWVKLLRQTPWSTHLGLKRIYELVEWVIISSNDYMVPIWRQALFCTNVDSSSVGLLRTTCNELESSRNDIRKKTRLKVSTVQCRPLCSDLEVITLPN